MRISDWSSDVCSSDLPAPRTRAKEGPRCSETREKGVGVRSPAPRSVGISAVVVAGLRRRTAPALEVAAVDHAVLVAVHVAHHLGEGPLALHGGHLGVAVGIEVLEAVDHAPAHGVEPELLVFAEGEALVLVGVEAAQALAARLVDLRSE